MPAYKDKRGVRAVSEAEDARVESLLKEARQRRDRQKRRAHEQDERLKELMREAIERLTPKTKGLMVPKAERDESRGGLERRPAQVPTQRKIMYQGTLIEPGDYGLS